jgi:ribonuclease/clavin/mitogillin
VASLLERFGPLRISKRPHARFDAASPAPITPIDDGSRLHAEGATLRAIHAPGHAEDHLCFVLEEEGSLFSGDNVLGVGTTVIPGEGGDLGDYMRSLARLQEEAPSVIYPAHGPRIDDGVAKLAEYVAHRHQREREILDALERGDRSIPEIVARV